MRIEMPSNENQQLNGEVDWYFHNDSFTEIHNDSFTIIIFAFWSWHFAAKWIERKFHEIKIKFIQLNIDPLV